MKYRALGRSDLEVSVVGFGCWAIGARNWGVVRDADSTAAVRRALELGVNFFDTADVYGMGHSEEVLGKAVRRAPDAIVATKAGLAWDENGRCRHDLSPSRIKAACDASVKRLGRDRIDLYQLHWPDPAVPLDETIETLGQLVAAGKIRYAGLCNFDVGALEAAELPDWVVAFQGRYSLFERGIEKTLVPWCRKAALGVIAYEPLFKGMLSGKYTEPPAFSRKDHRRRQRRFGADFVYYKERIDWFARVAAGFGLDPAPLALALLSEMVDTVIPGAKTAAQVEENAKAALIDHALLSQVKTEIEPIFGATAGAGTAG